MTHSAEYRRALEDAAKVCDAMSDEYINDDYARTAIECAHAIRSLAGQTVSEKPRVWITFQVVPANLSRKTGIWDVVTKDGGQVLGRISWWAAWRKYAFFPNGNTLYEPTCLRDIAAFIDEQMNVRRKP